MNAKMYSKMPTEIFFGSSDCLLPYSLREHTRNDRKLEINSTYHLSAADIRTKYQELTDHLFSILFVYRSLDLDLLQFEDGPDLTKGALWQ